MTGLVRDPGAIAELAILISTGAQAPRELVESLLARIAEVEGDVRAWCGIDREDALRQADECAREVREGKVRGPLHGIPFAVKDVIDVAGWPTRAGSRLRHCVGAALIDAEIVSAARAAGAIVLGKAHTTEFAYFEGPPPTRNPWNTERTPGGSSSGPAASVASGMALFSFGTQTAGSVARPAAYCGIAAFKPTTQSVSCFGVVPLAPSFDTPGYFAYRAVDAAIVARALQPAALSLEQAWGTRPDAVGTLRIGVIADDLLSLASTSVSSSLSQAEAKLAAAGHRVSRARPALPLEQLIALHTTISEYEIARALPAILGGSVHDVSEALQSAVSRGASITASAYRNARNALVAARHRFWNSSWDALIFPAAPGEAPVGMKTGDPRFVIPFTALAGPIMTVPTSISPNGLPLGLMVLGRPGSDDRLLATAVEMARAIELPRQPLSP